MLKKLLFLILAGLFFTSCAVKKDIIRSMQEDMPATVTVTTVPAQAEITPENSMETSLSTSTGIGLQNAAYKKDSGD